MPHLISLQPFCHSLPRKFLEQVRGEFARKNYTLTLKCRDSTEFERWVSVLASKCDRVFDNESAISQGAEEVDDGEDLTEEEKEQLERYNAQLREAAVNGDAEDHSEDEMPTSHSDRVSEVLQHRTGLAGENPLAASSPIPREDLVSRVSSIGISISDGQAIGVTVDGPITFRQELTKDFEALSAAQFEDIKSTVNQADGNKEKISVLSSQLGRFTFTCAQIKVLLDETTSIKTKLAMIELTVPRASDPKAGSMLFEQFKYATERGQVESVVKQRLAQLERVSSPGKSPRNLGGRGGFAGGRRGSGGRGAGPAATPDRNSKFAVGSPSSNGTYAPHKEKTICSGFLFKKSKYFGEWRRRYIRIINPSPGDVNIEWYTPKTEPMQLLGSFSLPEATFKQFDKESFRIVSQDNSGKVKTLELRGYKTENISKWCSTIEEIYKVNVAQEGNWLSTDEPIPNGLSFSNLDP